MSILALWGVNLDFQGGTVETAKKEERLRSKVATENILWLTRTVLTLMANRWKPLNIETRRRQLDCQFGQVP